MDMILLFKAFILGIVEGLTEFLPISSTGHLIIAGSLLDYDNEQSKIFDIVIQLGAILAVCWHFRARLASTIKGIAHSPREQHFALLVMMAFLPAAIIGFLLHGPIKDYLFNAYAVAFALIVGGLLILYIEYRPKAARITQVDDMDWKDALKVGFAQCVAMWPGVSRSGATIMGGMWFGLNRQAATEFSFYLAIPTMFAATFYDLAKSWQDLRLEDFPVFATGFVTSFIFGLIAVRALIYFISHHTFIGFAWYRIIFGSFVLISAWAGWVDWNHP
ncbi:MAG: undecaprenyl-diphosphate phosphatase [Zoogloeaceae bacterium]|jgi:undecaprenyl-diphosphatase|nr:undecaprenyl-diphosphate phosphatase [Zoogloeaceae bacterium]